VAAFFLVGPTAVGKTEIAHRAALASGCEILSADAMAVYREMNIGTAKPSLTQRREVKYHGIDIVMPDEEFNVGMYCEYAADILGQQHDRPLLVVGGSGMYIKALTQGLDELPGADSAIRERAEALIATGGIVALQEALQRKDAARYAKLADKNNPRRLVRAYELACCGAAQLQSWKAEAPARLVGLDMPREQLHARIATRVRKMFAEGLIAEAVGVLARCPNMSMTALQAIGYAEALAVARGELSEAEAVERVTVRTRRLAKRQLTWFRHQADVTWVKMDEHSDLDEVLREVQKYWDEYGPADTRVRRDA